MVKKSGFSDFPKGNKVNYSTKKSNVGGFKAGSEPNGFGPDDAIPGDKPEVGNVIGGVELPNDDKNQTYNDKLRNPKDPVLNAVPMPTKIFGEKNKSVLKIKESNSMIAAATVMVGGYMLPQDVS